MSTLDIPVSRFILDIQGGNRRSDVDLLVVANGGDERYGNDVSSLRFEVAEALGDSPSFFSVKVIDPGWLRERRQIESFFIGEVDRDKLILHGDELAPSAGGGGGTG